MDWIIEVAISMVFADFIWSDKEIDLDEKLAKIFGNVFFQVAAIAQLGERQTEDLKVPGSIPGVGIFLLSWVDRSTTFRKSSPKQELTLNTWVPRCCDFTFICVVVVFFGML